MILNLQYTLNYKPSGLTAIEHMALMNKIMPDDSWAPDGARLSLAMKLTVEYRLFCLSSKYISASCGI